jgi:hypothetical protein
VRSANFDGLAGASASHTPLVPRGRRVGAGGVWGCGAGGPGGWAGEFLAKRAFADRKAAAPRSGDDTLY